MEWFGALSKSIFKMICLMVVIFHKVKQEYYSNHNPPEILLRVMYAYQIITNWKFNKICWESFFHLSLWLNTLWYLLKAVRCIKWSGFFFWITWKLWSRWKSVSFITWKFKILENCSEIVKWAARLIDMYHRVVHQKTDHSSPRRWTGEKKMTAWSIKQLFLSDIRTKSRI